MNNNFYKMLMYCDAYVLRRLCIATLMNCDAYVFYMLYFLCLRV